MAGLDGASDSKDQAASNNGKPKRVRTGCLTCRERHLKCDEGLPTCLNCRKSSRECKRGVRLNFIDTQIEEPPTLAPNDDEWRLDFMDESRDIADEYQNGLEKYSALTLEPKEPPMDFENEDSMAFEFTNAAPSAPAMAHQSLPPIQGMMPGNTRAEDIKTSSHFFEDPRDVQQQAQSVGEPNSGHSHHSAMSSHQQQYDAQNYQQQQSQQVEQDEVRDILNTQEETLYMQVFVEEVGIWMDSMDSMKHVSSKATPSAIRAR